MDKQIFDESWPASEEGHGFADNFKLDQLRADKKSWGGRFASFFIGAVGIAALFMAAGDGDRSGVSAFLGVMCFWYLAYLSSRLRDELFAIRRELELVKGAIRANRFQAEWRHYHDEQYEGQRESYGRIEGRQD